MIITYIKDETSDAFSNPLLQEVWIASSGTGSGLIEIQCEDGIWRSYPEYAFTSPSVRLTTLPAGSFRFQVTGGPLIIQFNGRSL